MDPYIVLLAMVIGYLIGSISFSRLVTRLVKPDADLDNVILKGKDDDPGTRLRSMGATTASMKVGSRWGCFIGWLDILKVATPTLVFRLMFPEQPYYLLTAIFGMIGHNWPIYYKFRGGAGVSALYGGMIVVDFIGAIVCAFAGLLFGMFIVKDVLVAYLSGIWFLIPWFWFRTRDPIYVAYAIAVNIIIILALVPEIRDQIKSHREGSYDMQAAMDSFPMGRGMLKIMERFGINK
jgi:glycerol-3-phosphate acyltransferase PlsY